MRLVLGGYYGAGNVGDELLLSLLSDWLKKAGHDVSVATLDPHHTNELHGCQTIDRNDLSALLKVLSGADALILGGGGLFQDHDRFTVADLDSYPAPGVSYYAQLCLLARQLGVPYFLYGMGIGPLRTDEARIITREISQHASFITVRDHASATLLREIGVTTLVEEFADLGWLAPLPERLDLSRLFPDFADRRIAVVVPRDWPFSDGWQAALLQALAQLSAQGWGILWLPFQNGLDDQVVKSLIARLGPDAVQHLVECSGPEQACQIIASANALVAMRMHALVMGISYGIPTAIIEYDPKMSEMADTVGLDPRVRWGLADAPVHYCMGMDYLCRVSKAVHLPDRSHVASLLRSADSGRVALLTAIQRLQAPRGRSPWQEPHRDWVVNWLSSQVCRDSDLIRSLTDEKAELTSQLLQARMSTHTHFSLRLPPTISRAIDIIRTQGWRTLLKKIWRAGHFFLLRPILKRQARQRLAEILQRHSGSTPVLFPPIVPWNLPLFQRPHHIAKELGAHGYLYFFCIPPGGHDRVLNFEQVAPGCFITPHLDLIDALPRKIIHLYSTDNTHPLYWVRDRLANGDRVLYEYVDEIHEDISQREIPQDVRERHRYLLRNEEVVCVATADKLFCEVLQSRTRNCALITNGVDLAHFSVRRDSTKPPEQLISVVTRGKPIVGYFGALAKWFDYDLVVMLAQRRPDYEIVLIGPDYDGSLKVLEAHRPANLTLLGPVDYRALPRYACWFDAAMIPFRINDITESTSPIKLFEYMALGLPTVTTDLPECRKYESVLVAQDAGSFITLVDKALLLKSDSEYQATMKREAMQNAWSSKADALVALLRSSTSHSN